MQKHRVGITLGDLNGIGPEVVLKALADNRLMLHITPVIYGSGKTISFYKKLLQLEEFNYNQVRAPGQYAAKTINVVNCWEDTFEITPGKPSAEGGQAALEGLRRACQDLQQGLIDALVTAPIDKHQIHRPDFPFKGHTEFLTTFFGKTESLMFLVSEKLRVGLVTEHVALSQVVNQISAEKIDSKLRLMEQSLREDFEIQKPRIAVLALNPHAGDNGLMGDEDEKIIKPVVSEWRNRGKIVHGPFPTDGFFGLHQYAKYDGVLAMYHDQGLVPFKTLTFESGVNYTAGLPVVRTSPDHGTAFNIAGKNIANALSMRAAVYQAVDIFKVRSTHFVEKIRN